ncbi:MAG TPA: hypothetical protein VFI11_13570 [Anaerolineales bacterium]|nr:hypothetical protein [Anaerolineales bacterium]
MLPSRMAHLLCLGLAASMLLTGCNLPTLELPVDAGPAASATIAALATQVRATLVGLPTPVVSPVTTDSPTLVGDSPTPPPTATFTPSPTNVSPTARVNENTNCREGPGVIYDHEFTALKGSELPIIGRTTVVDYVIVGIPGQPGETCWLWTRYVSIVGSLDALPLSTPPPTPTPSLSFTLSYSYLEGCVGWDPGFKVVNTGNVTFKSAKIEVEDNDTSTTVDDVTDVFDKRSGCAVGTSIPELDPGDTGYVYANSFLYDPTGHDLDVKVTLCTGTGLTGQCISRTTDATP